jgi:amino acid adenylation domain-containing protein
VEREACVHVLFAAQAARTPHAIALVYEQEQLSYRELEERSNQLAHYLRRVGVGPDVVVGLCLQRSIDLVVGLLGILKAGGAYLPLDPHYPPERLAYMLSDAMVPVLLTQTHVAAGLPAHWARVVQLDGDRERIALQPRDAPASDVNSQNLAYVIYTSGSTGGPKGVMMPHAALSNHMRWMAQAFNAGSGDVILQRTPLSFDASVWEVFLPLLNGGRLVLARHHDHGDPRYLVEVCRQHQVSHLQMVPSLLELFVQSADNCKSLLHLFSGGEALSRELRDKVARHLRLGVHNLYGPTETCIQAVVYSTRLEEAGSPGRVPIGKAISHTHLHVLDEQLDEVPPGLEGELYIGGEALARGYLRRASMTAERFIASPSGNGERLYRTGDRVRYRADGNLEYLGRTDQQVKLRGYRIELGEIESAMHEQPGVRQAAVLAREDVPGEKRLVGYVVWEAEPADARALLESLRTQLPEYMVPATLLTLEKLPVTPNGKLDRAALPAPDVSGLREQEYVPARTPTEKALCEIWSQVLHVDRIGIQDNFFELGGQSLLATSVVAQIRETLDIELPVRAVFEAPTVCRLAEYLVKTVIGMQDPATLAEALARVRSLA